MKRTVILLAATLYSTTALAALSPTAEGFARKAAVGSAFEVQSSKLALQKSESEEVKDFAQKMIDDHTKASGHLQEALKDADADIAAVTSPALDAKHQAILDSLTKLSGEEFDQQYIDAQKDAHDEAVNLFTQYATSGDNAELKGFAENTLGTLKEHKEHVEEIDRSHE